MILSISGGQALWEEGTSFTGLGLGGPETNKPEHPLLCLQN